MGFQKLEYEFPHDEEVDEGTEIEVEESSAEVIAFDSKAKEAVEPSVKDEPEEEVKVEVVNDTPKNDRYRKDVIPEELTDADLEAYDGEVKDRLKSFRKGYHTERRAKEAAERERVEMERVTKQLFEENKQLKGDINKSQDALFKEAQEKAKRELLTAKALYKRAYEDGDSTKLVNAQEKLTAATLKQDKIDNFNPEPLQEPEPVVQREQINNPPPVIDERAAEWKKNNDWFNSDVEMTGYALGLHNKLVNDGVDPTSDGYYETINSRMRQLFPDKFDEGEAPPRRKNSNNVVAPATRSTAPRKVKLSKTQIALSKRLGLTPKQYAQQIAIDMRKQANG